MQAALILEWAGYILEKFIIDDSLFPPKWKDIVYDEGKLLPIYIYRKGTQEDPYYFDKELPK